MDITSANATYHLFDTTGVVFVVPQQLQGFSTDDAFATPEVDVAQSFIGVDGKFSAGFVPYQTKQTIMFQADSPSIPNVMEYFLQAVQASIVNGGPMFFLNATILIPSINRQYVLGPGILSRITPITQAKKVLQPVTYEISWAWPFASAPLG